MRVHDLQLFVTVQIFDDAPAVLSLGKLFEEHDYTFQCASGQKPHLTENGKEPRATRKISFLLFSQDCLQARAQVRLPHRYRRTHRMPLGVQQHYEVTIPTLKHRKTEAILLKIRN